MAKRQVFYSFHYEKDVARVQMIRNMGVIEGNPPASANDWESVKRGGDDSIKKWIDDSMRYRSCVIVLIGEDTATRKWVKYEIKKAWNERKGIFGIYVHNLKALNKGLCGKGANPFDAFSFKDGRKLSSVVKCYDPLSWDAYNDIRNHIDSWIETALESRK